MIPVIAVTTKVSDKHRPGPECISAQSYQYVCCSLSLQGQYGKSANYNQQTAKCAGWSRSIPNYRLVMVHTLVECVEFIQEVHIKNEYHINFKNVLGQTSTLQSLNLF